MKRSISILLCALMSAFVCAAAAGCDNIFDKREKLALPECVLLDDYVYWEQVAGAEGYVVSVNGEERRSRPTADTDWISPLTPT